MEFFMKQFIIIVFAYALLLTACSHNKTPSYLSIAVTSYNDNTSPKNGMTTTVFKYSFEGEPVAVGSVPYTSQYPYAVYDDKENSLYYSAVDESGKFDQLWRYNLDTKKAEKLTDSLFAINYIIPREDDIVMVACKRGGRIDEPYLFNKKNKTLTKLDFGIDFNCRLCTYQPESGRIIMSGYSEKECDVIEEAFDNRINPGLEECPPPSAYIYELKGDKPELLLKLEQYAIKNLAIINKNEIFYRGNPVSLVNSQGSPYTQFRFKTGGNPEEFELFKSEFPLEIYDDFIFASVNDVYFAGAGGDTYPQGIYHYDIEKNRIEPVYDSSKINGYANNFVFLKGYK